MTALPKHGPVKDRWEEHRKVSRLTVIERAAGRCEVGGCTNTPEAWHHLYGRRSHIAEPWASCPALTVYLCPDDHRAVHGPNPDLTARLRWIGIARLCAETKLPIPSTRDNDEMGAIRSLARILERRSRDAA